jgi:hypothetical protein
MGHGEEMKSIATQMTTPNSKARNLRLQTPTAFAWNSAEHPHADFRLLYPRGANLSAFPRACLLQGLGARSLRGAS